MVLESGQQTSVAYPDMTTPPLFPGFDGLMTLSRREGVDIRPTLLRVLTDLYVQASAHSGDEERQFVELTSRLIDQVDDATRAAVRARLAIYPGTPAEIADYDPDKFADLCSEKPAIHRFPGSMAKRIQTLAQIVVDRYDGDAAGLWTAGDPDGSELLRRIKGLPGFGDVKAQIFLALLGKQYGVTPKGWRAAAGDFGDAGSHISVADIVDDQSMGKVRAYKKQMKAAAKAAK